MIRTTARAVALLTLAVLGVSTSAASAQALVVSPTPDPSVAFNGAVNAVVQSGGRVYVGGSFSRAGVETPRFADVGLADGAASLATARPNIGPAVTVSDGAGGWYIGGQFTTVGTTTRNRLAHVLADGSVDPQFDPNLNNTVSSLLLSGNRLYVGGSFTTVNGSTTRNRLAALDATTGVVDPAFDPDIRVDTAATPSVNALALSGNKLYAGGNFTLVNATVVRHRLAAFDATTGAVDPTFDPNVGGNVGGLTNFFVNVLAVANGRVYAGGDFQAVNGDVARRNLAAFDPTTGAVDLTFDPDVASTGSNFGVSAMVVSGQKVYAGGFFTFVNGTVPRNRLAAFDATTGAVDPSFDPNLDSRTRALALVGTTLYVAGDFTTVNFTLARNRLAAFDVATGTATSFDPEPDGTVTGLAAAGGRLAVSGSYTFIGASSVHNDIAALRPDGTVDPSFMPSLNGAVNALALSGSKVYAGGAFTTVNGTTTRNRLAAFDTASGAVDPAFDPNLDAAVGALALSGSTLYAGGSFTTTSGGATARNRLAAFDTATGSTLPGFDPNVTNGAVNALALGDGRVYAGGTFSTVNGSTTRNGVAAFGASSGVVTPFDVNVSSPNVLALAVSGATLFIGGDFNVVHQTTRLDLAAADSVTGNLLPVTANLPNQASTQINAFALSGTTLYVGGQFTSINGVNRNRLAALDATTLAVDPTFDPNVGAPRVGALAMGDHTLHAGGSFSTVNGSLRRVNYAQFTQSVFTSTATTGPASAIAPTAATLGGTVNPSGSPTTVVFEYGPSTSFGSITGPTAVGAGSADVAVSSGLSGLQPGTTYWYRLVSTSSAGTTFGAVLTFRTTGGTPLAPAVTTLAASAATTTTATISGTVNPNGQATAYTFEYGPSTSFGAITTVVALDDATTAESVSAALTGLMPDTRYAYRVVATNATGTSVGAVLTFDTGPGGTPTATTGAATAIAATGATLTGTVDAHGLQTAFTFAYGTSPSALGSITALDNAVATNGPQAVALPATGLAPGTTYYFRLVTANAAGTSVGAIHAFTTASGT